MKIAISVPTPCHEDWNAMSPRQQGRHCAQCDHVVADLTTATDAQLIALFTSDAKPKCARFDPKQLDRALGATEHKHARVLPLAAFTSLVAVAAGHEAMAQGGPVTKPVMLGEPAIAQPPPPPPLVTGKMMVVPHSIPPRCDRPIIGDTVSAIIREPDPIEERIETGNVAIRVDDTVKGDVRAVVQPAEADHPVVPHSIPCMPVHKQVDPEPATIADLPPSDPRDGEGPLGIAGFVEDVRTGRMLHEAIVRLRGTDVRVRCNDRGYFGLQVPEGMVGRELILDIQVPGSGDMALPLPPKGTPFYAPIKFRPEEPITTMDLSPFVIERERQIGTLGGPRVVRYEVPPTFWQRIMAPIKRGWNNVRH